ncbi:MAG: UDP-N-acetylglucosamine 2-epimerase (non-hydrolyzing) [Bacteroidota bacterium]|nr:UDP-N-acetylglucosamine 2-epimerase (non-hydrolyzing) [Bacteroidota bacterium]
MKRKILIVVGTRPNFIKVTQFKKVAENFPFLEFKIVHTGQHYDAKMADVFFEQFGLTPDFFLNVPPSSPTSQVAMLMTRLEELISTSYLPDMMLVVGDVNSTLAAAITANKSNIPLAHIESGLRSYDRTMPEEHNRLVTDSLSDFFFVTEPSGTKNLLAEGKPESQIFFVGNTMIDTMVAFKDSISSSGIQKELGLVPGEYILMTMHRPATVDDAQGLNKLLTLIREVTATYKIVFPIHPRTLKNLKALGISAEFEKNTQLVLTPPLDYFAFQNLIAGSKMIITDSGGIQEESTFAGIPCLTLRPNTERPVTCDSGTNTLVPFNLEIINSYISQISSGSYKKGTIPEFWDGNATKRIVKVIDKIVNK